MANEYMIMLLLAAMVFGASLGVLTAGLMRTAGGPPEGAPSQSDVMSAYLLGYQDGAEGVPLTSRPAPLHDPGRKESSCG